MSIVAIISEYNPFHSGHLYQINKIKDKIPDAKIIVIMSGNFVQRGEPAILDKHTRSKHAILNGVDLVLQMPTIYSLQSAENFAFGGISVIKSLNCVDYISFGIESSNFSNILQIANTQYNNYHKLHFLINNYMDSGKSYSVAYKDATFDLFNNKIIDDIFLSNNILAIEYIKNIKKLNVNIDYYPIHRQGNNYLDENISITKFSSATSIRKAVLNNKTIKIKDFLEDLVYSDLLQIQNISQLNNYFDILKYNLLVLNRSMENITGYEYGLENLFLKNILKASNFDELIKLSISKRYKKGRIQRLLINYLLNIQKNLVDDSLNSPLKYVKILGFNNSGREILHLIKKQSKINLVTKHKDFFIKDHINNEIYNLENRATDLFNILNNNYIKELENKVYFHHD